MGLHRIRRGLDLPLPGAAPDEVETGATPQTVAFIADDYPGLRPRLLVQEGAPVRRGQCLLHDRARPGVCHAAPGAGRVESIHRGEGRSLQSIVIRLSDEERHDDGATETLPPDSRVTYESWSRLQSEGLTEHAVRALLLESGAWVSLRSRPYERVPTAEADPDALMVSVLDTNPLAPNPERVLEHRLEDFDLGLQALSALTPRPLALCVGETSRMPEGLQTPVQVERFAGPHPSGTVGLQIHRLFPVGPHRTVWHAGYQDVAAIGSLVRSGVYDVRRTVSVAGPALRRPRLVTTRIGARLPDLAPDEAFDGSVRWISGSALAGKACTVDPLAYLGRFDNQVTVLPEGGEREFLGWAFPGRRRFTVLRGLPKRVFARAHAFTTNRHGASRTIIPLGLHERVFPFDMEPTLLLRALQAGDAERAAELGCLELSEEDLALCTFVDPGKGDFGPALRRTLTALEEGGA